MLASGCDIAFDNLTRRLYATDASIYEIVPSAVAFPKNEDELSALLKIAHENDVPITPRGAGSGLAGGAIGEGIIIDLSRYLRSIDAVDLEKRTVKVQPGVVLDRLNGYLKPYGYCFGPDVATSSRATVGGMIASDSSGARAMLYGTTANHIRSLTVALADGRIDVITPRANKLQQQQELAKSLVLKYESLIRERLPAGLIKRWHGYALGRFLDDADNLNHIIAGSEGTLAVIVSAELNIVPLPKKKGLGIIFFKSVSEALQATVELLGLKPAAIEHIDRILFDQTRGQIQFAPARELLGLDSQPCESFLIVEFLDEETETKLELLKNKRLGIRTLILQEEQLINLVWELRKAGLSLLSGCKGCAKPVTGIEDVAVSPEKLPEFIDSIEGILKPLGLNACYYGHAASGLLHIRPVLDLRKREDLVKFRKLADEVAKIVKKFKGSIAAEHGVGIARTEYLPDQIGAELYEVMRQIKFSFDPKNVLNPGKIIGDGRYKIDSNLRMGECYALKLPFDGRLLFKKRDESFVANLEQCNGCGGCRKEAPTMCPTFIATGEEAMSTRGRVNIIRAALDIRNLGRDAQVGARELSIVLESCLSCKACASECPSNVNMAFLKAELLNARHNMDGVPLQARVFGAVDKLGKMASIAPALFNFILNLSPVRYVLLKTIGITDKRPLPSFANETFLNWFSRRKNAYKSFPSGKVILWDDTFARYYEPNVAKAAVTVLESAGYEVLLLKSRKCCGRPAFSQGLLEKAAKYGQHNLNLLTGRKLISMCSFDSVNGEVVLPIVEAKNIPIIFLEPSCYSMFVDEYIELGLDGAEEVADRCYLFEDFLNHIIEKRPDCLDINPYDSPIAIHSHCHAKALMSVKFMGKLASKFTRSKVTLLETGCCGMAGAFGAKESNYELSRKIGLVMAQVIESQPPDTIIVASGTSCRQQISHLTSRTAKHFAELVADSLKSAPV